MAQEDITIVTWTVTILTMKRNVVILMNTNHKIAVSVGTIIYEWVVLA